MQLGEEIVALDVLPDRVRQALEGRSAAGRHAGRRRRRSRCDELFRVMDQLREGGVTNVNMQTQPATAAPMTMRRRRRRPRRRAVARRPRRSNRDDRRGRSPSMSRRSSRWCCSSRATGSINGSQRRCSMTISLGGTPGPQTTGMTPIGRQGRSSRRRPPPKPARAARPRASPKTPIDGAVNRS